MMKFKPKCYNKCNECFFYYIDGCIALPGEDCFVAITDNHAQLIVKNQNRFDISGKVITELKDKFPSVKQQQCQIL